MSTEADPFSCFDCSDSESSDDGDVEINDITNDGLEQGRRLAIAANARQSNNASFDHVPVTGSGFEVFSCEDANGYCKGQMGIRALRPYAAGEEILRERPAMRIRTSHAASSREEAEEKYEAAINAAFRVLSPQTANAVMDLSSAHEQNDDGGDAEEEQKTVIGIFETNNFQLGDEADYGGLFLGLARINHSCRPNSVHHWRPDLHMMVLHAARDIAAGEEICDSYGPFDFRDTEGRRKYLREKYSFECGCGMCMEGNDTGSDDRMVELAALHESITFNMAANIEPELSIQNVEHCLELLKEQGIGHPMGPHVKPILHCGYQICLAGLHDKVRARSYLSRELLSVNSSEGLGSYKSIDIQKLLDDLDVELESN